MYTKSTGASLKEINDVVVKLMLSRLLRRSVSKPLPYVDRRKQVLLEGFDGIRLHSHIRCN
jgi:hypothetical protein